MLEALTALNLVAITESDSTIYDPPLKMLIILPDGTGGDVVIENEKGTEITIPVDATVTHPIYLPGRIQRVLATGTDMDDAYIFGVR